MNYKKCDMLFHICLLLAAALLSSCGRQQDLYVEETRVSFDELLVMDGTVIYETRGNSSVHASVNIPCKEAPQNLLLVPDEEKARDLGLEMEENGYVDFERFKVMVDGELVDALPPNCSFAGDGEQSRKFGYFSDIQAEGLTVSPVEATRKAVTYMQEVTGISFQTYRVITSNPLKEGDTGEYWIWMMLDVGGIPIQEVPGDIGVIAKYSAQGVYAYYGRFLFRIENENPVDAFENPHTIAEKFLDGNFGQCEKIELVYIKDFRKEEETIVPAWVFYVQGEQGLKAYEYSADDGSLLNVRDMDMMW